MESGWIKALVCGSMLIVLAETIAVVAVVAVHGNELKHVEQRLTAVEVAINKLLPAGRE